MRKIKYISTILFVLVLISSCEKDIDYKGSKLDDFLVLNANLMVDSVITCSVTKGVSILVDEDVYPITDAAVELYEDNELLESLQHVSDGLYKSVRLHARPNANYTIKVRRKPFNPIEASIGMQGQTDAEINSITPNNETGKSRIQITIKDTPGDDFYRIRIFETTGEDDPLYSKFYYESFWEIQPESDDPVLNDNRVKTSDDFSDLPSNTFNIFNDELFNDQVYTLYFDVYLREESIPGVRIDVQKISKDLYLYYKTLQARDYYEDSPFSEPVRIHSNVNGGAGILGSTTSKWLRPQPGQIVDGK